MRHRGQCLGRPESRPQPPVARSERAFVAVQAQRALPQQHGDAWFASPAAAALSAVEGRLPRRRPPLILVPGHRPAQEAMALALGKALKSGPTSLSSACTVRRLMVGICVRSTPKMRSSCAWSSAACAGWFLDLPRLPAAAASPAPLLRPGPRGGGAAFQGRAASGRSGRRSEPGHGDSGRPGRLLA